MSSPIDRPSDTDGISRYAPKWARDVDNLLQQHLARPQVRTVGGTNTASLVPADSPEYDRSLAPIIMPEPPVPEPWLRNVGRTLLRGGGRMAVIVPILVAMVLSALIALVIVVVWPSIWSIAAKQLSTESEPPRPQSHLGRVSTANCQRLRLRHRPSQASRASPALRVRIAPSRAPTLGSLRSIRPLRRSRVHRRSRCQPLQRPRWLIRHP